MFNKTAVFDTDCVRSYRSMFKEGYHFTKPMFSMVLLSLHGHYELYKSLGPSVYWFHRGMVVFTGLTY